MISAESDALKSARTHRRSLAVAFRSWVGSSNLDMIKQDGSRYDVDGPQNLDRAWLAEGPGAGAELRLEARPQPWKLDLEDTARRLLLCETGGVVLWDVAGGKWCGRVLGCGVRVCPVCARARAARAAVRWRAVLEAAAADGAVFRHLTLTQRADAAPGGLVTTHELRRGWRGTLARPDLEGAKPTGGESLGGSYRRLRGALRAVRQGRATRERWRLGLGAYLVGCEWTGRGPGGVPRWHVHAHILTCHPRGEAPSSANPLLEDWARAVDGSPRAQHARDCEADALAEVLKYPFKPAHLTSAMRIETLAYARGLHPHHVGGAWHATAKAHHEKPWATWLAARPPRTPFRRLHLLRDELDTPTVYTGQVTEGPQRWALQDGSGGWRTWTARAEPFAELLGRTPGAELPEPGSDEGEELFRS